MGLPVDSGPTPIGNRYDIDGLVQDCSNSSNEVTAVFH